MPLCSQARQLQKDTTWKDIKDFLHEANIVPDNVEVFEKSSSGWIRFLGSGDFYAAIGKVLAMFNAAYAGLTAA